MAIPRPTAITSNIVAGILVFISLLFLLCFHPQQPPSIPLPSPPPSHNSTLCASLLATLPGIVYNDPHPSFFSSLRSSYAQQAQEQRPSCIVQPRSAEDVSAAVKTLRAAHDAGDDARFAVRSGGHRTGAGHSSIEGGVLLDLSLINEVTISEDRQAVMLGVGSRWGRVYDILEGEGLAVAGGRDAGVGVGGFLLGGGISFFSPRVGMACDNVVEYEIVLANGTIALVSKEVQGDLWRVLKGGSSNFGIVTRVRVKAFPSSDVWGGYVLSPYFQIPKILRAFHDFVDLEEFDESAASPIVSMAYVQFLGIKAVGASIVHMEPGKWPSIWRKYKAGWGVLSFLKRRSLSNLAAGLQAATTGTKRQLYATITIRNDLPTLLYASELLKKYNAQMKHVKGLLFSIVVQPLPRIPPGGSPNVLGLDSRDANEPNLVVLMICPSWKLEADDETVHRIGRSILDDARHFAVKRGVFDEFVYLNYAGDWQDPLASYGDEKMRFMRETSRRHDPAGLWQTALEGGFKLGL